MIPGIVFFVALIFFLAACGVKGAPELSYEIVAENAAIDLPVDTLPEYSPSLECPSSWQVTASST